jgi:hypothetical protein
MNNSRICSFDNVKNGELFRVLKPEYVETRKVLNGGLYVKVGAIVAVDISTNTAVDCVFLPNTMCKVLPKLINPNKFDTFKICQGTYHANS